MVRAKYRVTYPTLPSGTTAATTRATDAYTAIARARRSGIPAPAGRTVDLNAEPEVQIISRGDLVHVYGPRYGGR